MPQIVFLNERSRPIGQIEHVHARGTVDRLIDVLLRLRRLLPAVSVIADERILRLQVGDGYSIPQWMNEVARERRQFLLSLANFAPFAIVRDLVGDRDPGATAYTFSGPPFHGISLEGVGLADLYGCLAISFDLHQGWQISSIPTDVEQLLEDEESRWTRNVIHAATTQHVEEHKEWITNQARRDVPDAEALWDKRTELLPHLRFLPAVGGDLLELQPPAFRQVLAWLYKLNDSVGEWLTEGLALPNYPPHTTDESQMRRAYCWWDDGGVSSCFSWHGRYTPGAGRIHFRLAAEEKRAVIGYIGLKLSQRLVR